MRFAKASTFLAVLLMATPSMAEQQRQEHDPETCGIERACVVAAWTEYQAGIEAELRAIRRLAPEAGRVVKTGDIFGANGIINAMKEQGLYRHNTWRFPSFEHATLLGKDFDEFERITDSCRVAIIQFKWAMSEISRGKREDASDSWKDYQDLGKKCLPDVALKARRK